MSAKETGKRWRIFADVSPTTFRDLILWAEMRGEKKNSWVATVLNMRVAEALPKIEAWLEREAKRLGVTATELEQKVLEKHEFDFEAYRKEMLNED